MARIRVLQVTNSLNFGGLERLVVDLCRHMDHERFEPAIACLAREGSLADEARAAGIRVHLLRGPATRLGAYTAFRRLQALARAERIDVLHTHNSGPLLDGFLASVTQRAPLPIVHTDHNRVTWPDLWHRMLLERVAARYVGGVVAVSPDARDNLHRHERIPQKRIRVIDNGIDLGRFAAPATDTAQWLASVDAAQFRHRIAVVAMHRPRKGLDHMLRAMPAILQAHPATGLLLAGGGPLDAELRQLAAELGIEANVRFLGRRSDIPDLLRASDLSVLPSEAEGLPLSILEAMAARCCIVATSVGAIPDVLESGRCGVLVPPGDSARLASAVIELLQAPDLRAQLVGRAWERAERDYSIAATVRAYELLYVARIARGRTVD
jgi:glycosyltransferase involved in cell wall biosynthesis